jgi:lipopolysaccharide/colanic/teichoic acid biosynthesis glycosyltransferase
VREDLTICLQSRTLASRAAKRAFDVAFACCALLLTLPVLVLAIVLIRLETPGRAIFRQTRMGKDGRPFQLYKLRGMFIDARESFPALYEYSATRDDLSEYYYHSGADPRVTRMGRVLRRFSIDELPNFVNVIRGHMSVVGPRPEIPELAYMYGDWLTGMLSVRPGVTSQAKATGRDSLSLAETIEQDRWYIVNQSLWVDIKIIARTVTSALRGKDAF